MTAANLPPMLGKVRKKFDGRGRGNGRRGVAEWLEHDLKSDRAEMSHVVAVIRERLDDPSCQTLADLGSGTRTVLAALFQPPYRTPPGHSKRTRAAVLRLNGVAADGAES